MKKLVLTLTQLPLLTGLWLFWEPAKARPVFAFFAGMVYEAIIFGLAFGKKVWLKLEDRAVQYSADWVINTITKFGPGFRTRYKKQVLNDYSIFNVRGLGLINTYTLPLEQIFVDLRIDPSNPQKLNIDLLAQKEQQASKPIWDFLRSAPSKPGTAFDAIGNISYGSDTFFKNPALAIIGPPGSGKTTLLQHIALTLASNRQKKFNLKSSTPILLFLRDHTKHITEQQPSLGNLLHHYFAESSRFAGLNPPSGWFERELERGKCLVLLDGLDEVAGLKQRQTIAGWVDDQVKNYPLSRFVLTARPQGYRDAPLQRANVLEVQPFTPQQVQKFIENWYLANEIMASGGNINPGVRGRATKEAADLLQRLRLSPPLTALTVNPLLLTMLAMVHRYHGALPETRVELYAEICEVLLGRWRQTKGIQDTLTAAHKLAALRPLAARMMERKLRDIRTSDANAIIATPLKRLGIVGEAASVFLSDLQATSGLVLEREIDHWSFAHLTFQEYLTASEWHREHRIKRWAEMVGDSWWHEALRLYAAQGDATELVQACLDADALPALILAAECLDEKCEIEFTVRQAVETRVIADLESSDLHRRRFAAEVQLTKRLKSLQQIDEQRQIDLDYITCAEYQLFCDDTDKQGRARIPDHWRGAVFKKGDALKAVSGIRAEDAAAFCQWVTRRHGGSVTFRLPSVDEANEYPARQSELASWCGRDGWFELSEISAENISKIRRQLTNLSRVPLAENAETLDFIGAFTDANQFLLQTPSVMNTNIGQLLIPLIELSRDLVAERDNSRNDHSRVRELVRALALSLALKLDAELAENKMTGLDPTIAALDRNDLVAAQLSAEIRASESTNPTRQMIYFLAGLLSTVNTADMNTLEALQGIITSVVELMHDKEQANVRHLLKLYWCFQIVTARQRGELHSWEGIRIVWEQF